jgi:hypothetical protein
MRARARLPQSPTSTKTRLASRLFVELEPLSKSNIPSNSRKGTYKKSSNDTHVNKRPKGMFSDILQ